MWWWWVNETRRRNKGSDGNEGEEGRKDNWFIDARHGKISL